MKTENFYKLVIVLLLLLNIGTLGYLSVNKDSADKLPPRHHPPRPDRIIMERLQLNDEQVEQFNELKHEHHTQMLEIQEHAGKLHKALFALLEYDTVDMHTKDSLLELIQVTNLEKEEVTFEHFRKLRQILTEEQKHEFDEFVEDISSIIMGPHHRRKR